MAVLLGLAVAVLVFGTVLCVLREPRGSKDAGVATEELELRASNAVAFERSLDTGRSLDSRLDRGGPRPPPRASDARDDGDDDDATARWRFWRRHKSGARDLT